MFVGEEITTTMSQMDKTEQLLNEHSAIRNAFVDYLERVCHHTGKSLKHYPDVIDKYMPLYVRNHINRDFDNFYDLTSDEIDALLSKLRESHDWENELKRESTWKLRLNAIEKFISFKKTHENSI